MSLMSVGLSLDVPSVGLPSSSKRAGSYTSMLLSEHLLFHKVFPPAHRCENENKSCCLNSGVSQKVTQLRKMKRHDI